ncbi:LuxR family transcriptional regulator [Sphingobium fuliginis]|nr:LuxR family transcriptional regulator [Sphingobium fuliginis]
MRLGLVELLGNGILTASSIDHLHEALTCATHDMGFDRFALSLEIGCSPDSSTSLLIHDYPASWADVYIGFNLAATDPVRRAAERSVLGFGWRDIHDLVPMTEVERTTFETGRKHGLADGFTVPRHLPGDTIGSCSFVTGLGRSIPHSMLIVAEMLGAMAIAAARRLSGWAGRSAEPKLTDRQRDCVLWAARGKTDWEISRILGISHDTVIQHLKDARERYETHKRASLILYALYDGLISFADIFRWRVRS